MRSGVDAVRPAAEARGITIELQLDTAASRAVCDVARMQQVVWNMVANAVKFTPKGGQVTVEMRRETSDTMIRVRDSGQGIDADMLPYIFERFRQVDGSTRRSFGGLGLGLSIVKHIVEAHGGTVEVESPGKGFGSTFTVRLPVAAVFVDDGAVSRDTGVAGTADSGHVQALGAANTSLKGLRILAVDDDPDARRVLVQVIEAAGGHVRAVDSAAAALEALASDEHTDVLVSDLGMPGQDGFDLIREVRAAGHQARDLPAVALTAFAQKEYTRRALLAGFQVHVAKPVDPDDLTAAIAGIAGQTGGPG